MQKYYSGRQIETDTLSLGAVLEVVQKYYSGRQIEVDSFELFLQSVMVHIPKLPHPCYLLWNGAKN